MTKKRLIVCADGTGNRGGYTPDSNVYKIYNAIDIRDDANPQIKFYDNGVGTSKNKFWRGLSGAFGFGFGRNVCDLYEFLARNYEPGDDVFLFGFSRGAATVRALSGFIAAVGLVDGRGFDQDAMDDAVKKAFTAYKNVKTDPSLAKQCLEAGSHGAIRVEFIGVWDTVSALGFPQHWAITGLGMWVLNGLFKALDHASDVIFPHRFYNYELTNNVAHAYQALAIDDERNSFRPMVWNELGETMTTDVEQVWFAGAHSNVGGGYGRAGVANVALDWMMTRAKKKHGLTFESGALDDVGKDRHVHGRLYSSRDGLAVYYRYAPRDIEQLCDGVVKGKVRIHRSVFARLARRTANYAPGHLPFEFDVVDTAPEEAATLGKASSDRSLWMAHRKEVNRWVWLRKWLYGIFLEFTLLVVILGLVFWGRAPATGGITPATWSFEWLAGHLANALNYVAPKFLEGLVTVAVIEQPWMFGVAVVFLLALYFLRKWFQHGGLKARERARETVLAQLDPSSVSRSAAGSVVTESGQGGA